MRYGFLMFVYLQVRKYLFSSERQYLPAIQPMGADGRGEGGAGESHCRSYDLEI